MKKLSNHLNILQTPTSTIAVNVLVNTGSRNETLEDNGISHLLEHLIYKSIMSQDDSALKAPWLETFSAETHKNHTDFEFEIDTEDQRQISIIVSQILNFSKVTAIELKKEISVLIEELTEDEENEHFLLYQRELDWCYNNSSLSLPVGGTIKSLKNITPEQISEYHKKYYQPNNIVVSAVGKLNTKKLQNDLSVLNKPIVRTNFLPSTPLKISNYSDTLYLEKKSNQIEFSESKFSNLNGFSDVIRFEFFATTLHSYLFHKLRKLADVYDISINQYIYSDFVELNAFIKYGQNKHKKLLSLYYEAMQDFSKISLQELENAKKLFLQSKKKDQQDAPLSAHYLSWYSALFGAQYSFLELNNIIESLAHKELLEFSKQFSLGKPGQITLVGNVSKLEQ